MKKCQMHNKKRDKLSYTVMLHYSAVTGGFVCHFLVHLHDFRQWAVQWAAQIFSDTGTLAPAHKCLHNLFSSPACRDSPPGTQSFTATGTVECSTLLALVTQSLVWTPSRVTLPLQGAGEAAILSPTCRMVLDLPQPSRSSEHTLGRAQTSPIRSGLHWGHRAQNPPMAPPPPIPVQFWGRRTFDQPSHPFCCYSCISCNHSSGCELLKRFKGLPNGEEAARQEIVAPCNLPGYCNCYALYADWQVHNVPTYTKQILFSGRHHQTLPCCIIYNILWTIQNNSQNTSMRFCLLLFSQVYSEKYRAGLRLSEHSQLYSQACLE